MVIPPADESGGAVNRVKTLILGGVRCGKSRLAETLAAGSELPVVYIATCVPRDREMSQRIEAHRRQRPAHWTVIEEPIALGNTLRNCAAGCCVVVECLTLWLTNLLADNDLDALAREQTALLDAARHVDANIIFVGNETNMGIIPMGELVRRYCDHAGALHQALAGVCDRVMLVVAGLPYLLKGADA